MDDKIYYIWLSESAEALCDRKAFLMELFGGAEGVYRATASELDEAFARHPEDLKESFLLEALKNKDLRPAERSMRNAAFCGAKIIRYGDPLYPAHLAAIPDPPVVLYAAGNTELLKERGVGVVGTRRASPYGRWVSEEIGRIIAECGVTVVSGMAAGIDAQAHTGCLKAGGGTIAVFGTGIDICFPKSNYRLYREILDKGLAISEVRPGYGGFAFHFPLRNRIISGLSKNVVIVEGAPRSGSMITAARAMEQGRDVFAVPGNINQPNSLGTNMLIADGAYPVLSLDILPETLGIGRRNAAALAKMSEAEKNIYKIIEDSPGCGPDGICAALQLSAAEISALLSAMEIKGLIRSEGSRRFVI